MALFAPVTGLAEDDENARCAPDSTCEKYRETGKLYSNPGHSLFQEFTLVGRFQFQSALLRGEDDTGEDISFDRNEVRRFYLGAGFKAFGFLDVSGQANIFRDTVEERGFEFMHMWDLMATVDANKAFGWIFADSFKIGYGAAEVNMSEEWNVSSKMIKTIERSSISNKIWPFNQESGNPTGVFANWRTGALTTVAGVFSTTTADFWADWNDGVLYHVNFKYDCSHRTGAETSELLWTMFYQDVKLGEEALADGVEWATSLANRYGLGSWTLRLEGIAGSNGVTNKAGEPLPEERRGSFWGLVVLPTVWLKGNLVEGVARYQFQSSSRAEGVGVNGRYVRAPDAGEIILPFPTRGDSHHSFLAGVNTYLCGDNLKLMFDVQYDKVTSRGNDVISGWTAAAAFRTFF